MRGAVTARDDCGIDCPDKVCWFIYDSLQISQCGELSVAFTAPSCKRSCPCARVAILNVQEADEVLYVRVFGANEANAHRCESPNWERKLARTTLHPLPER